MILHDLMHLKEANLLFYLGGGKRMHDVKTLSQGPNIRPGTTGILTMDLLLYFSSSNTLADSVK